MLHQVVPPAPPCGPTRISVRSRGHGWHPSSLSDQIRGFFDGAADEARGGCRDVTDNRQAAAGSVRRLRDCSRIQQVPVDLGWLAVRLRYKVQAALLRIRSGDLRAVQPI